jgi:hypothetical protein
VPLEQPARALIEGSMPMHDVEAPSPGSGKDLLAHVLAVPFVGEHLAASAFPSSEEERRKKITSIVAAGRPIFLIDNLSHALVSDVLNVALTCMIWEDRLLGQNALVRAPLLHTWLLTANNPIFDTQTARRIVRSRLDPRVDRPWLRAADSFRHPDLRAWALENRGELMWAVLVLIQAWLDQGRPPGKATLGSYESWARVIGGILSNAGIAGFLGNVHQLYERADTEGATWRALVAKWWDTFKDTAVGTSDLYPLALALDTFNFGKATTERGQRTVLGQKLAQQEDRVIGDYRVVPADREHNTQQLATP